MDRQRILFVDDEPQVLSGLKRNFRAFRKQWHLDFASSAAEALERIEEQPVDVVVTDMRMGGMDGADLLTRLHQTHPQIIRIVLSGAAEIERIRMLVPIAHQFLSKPCEPEKLTKIIEKTRELLTLLNDEQLRVTIGGIQSLPSAPRVYGELTRLLNNPQAGASDLAAVVEQDVAITAKLLQLANSAFFRLSREVTTVEQAIQYLGGETIKSVALAVEVFRSSNALSPLQKKIVEQVQVHSLTVASVAAKVAEKAGFSDRAFCAGILHDVGLVLVASEFPDELTASDGSEPSLGELESRESLRGTQHAHLGAYLLGIWGLPFDIIEAVATHDQPQGPRDSLDLAESLKLAELVVQCAEDNNDSEARETLAQCCAHHGLEASIEVWIEQAMSRDLQTASR